MLAHRLGRWPNIKTTLLFFPDTLINHIVQSDNITYFSAKLSVSEKITSMARHDQDDKNDNSWINPLLPKVSDLTL